MNEEANRSDETSYSESLAAPLLEAGLIDILQKNSDISEGSCPWCGEEDYPVDKNNKRIEGPNVENAEEWRLDHDDTCAVTLIEKLLKSVRELHRVMPVVDGEIKITYKHNKPYGIRDKGGYLFFFAGIDKYSDQEERYRQEIEQQFRLADYLLAALEKA